MVILFNQGNAEGIGLKVNVEFEVLVSYQERGV